MADSAEAEAPPDQEQDDRASIMQLLERFGRDSTVFTLREAELTAARHSPEVRSGARDVTAGVAAGVVLGTAFLLANWAAVRALSGPLEGWRAPLVLAAVWLVVGIALAMLPLARVRRLLGWQDEGGITIADRERRRDEALGAVEASLELLAAGIADEAQERIIAAMLPSADDLVDVGEDLLEAADELLDEVVEDVPGGSVIGQVIDFVLIPGKYGVRVATTVLRGDPDS